MKRSVLCEMTAVVFLCIVSPCFAGENIRVNFYGMVVDQYSNPVPDVKIDATVRHWHVLALYFGASWPHLNAKTDKDGRFRLHGASGDSVTPVFQKDGYEVELEGPCYGAQNTITNPVIFKMYPTNLHEKLISYEKKFHVVPDGRLYYINLTNGTIAESGQGDIKVWIKYPEQTVRGQLYDWACEVEVVDGGLCQDDSYYRSVAPVEGYVPTFKLQQEIKGGQRGKTGEKRFYLKLNNGPVYGKMTITLHAPYNDQIPGLIRLSYAINPTGSRILR